MPESCANAAYKYQVQMSIGPKFVCAGCAGMYGLLACHVNPANDTGCACRPSSVLILRKRSEELVRRAQASKEHAQPALDFGLDAMSRWLSHLDHEAEASLGLIICWQHA